MSNIFARFVKDESGATAIEYGLIAALIALAIMVGAGAVGNSLDAKFNEIASELNDSLILRRFDPAGLERPPHRAAFSFARFRPFGENPRHSFHRRLRACPYDWP